MSSFESDYQWGKQQEVAVYRYLRRYFGRLLTHNTDEYAEWDFEDPDVAVELKSRHCLSTDYATAMIKTLKVTNCESETRDCFLFFNYLDRLCFIQYDAQRFARYSRRTMKIPSRVDKTEVWESRTFIPVADLKTLRTYPVPCLLVD